MSTPRTKENTLYYEGSNTANSFYYLDTDFGEKLETELQACHAVMEDMKAALEAYKPNSGIFTREQLRKKALASYAKIKSQKP